MIIAQITDLHVQPAGGLAYGVVDTNHLLKAAVAQLNRLQPQPDLVVATGDLVDEGTEAEYDMLKSLLAPLQAPLYLGLGNHDNRDAFRKVFSDLPYVPSTGLIQYTIEDFPVRMLMLDTLVDGEGYGEMDEPRLHWLESQLAAIPDRPTIVFMHHPPFSTRMIGLDDIKCRGGDAMAEIIARYPCVQRVACGHLHRSIQIQWAETGGSVAPSVAHQVALRLHSSLPAAFVMEPPAFHLHVLSAGSLVTHTAYVGDFEAYSYDTKAPMTLYA